MFELPYYHGIIRKTLVGFGTLFSNMQIPRQNSEGVVTQTVNVPIAYGPKEKWYVRADQDTTLQNSIYTSIPRMSFELTGYNYDPARMVSKNQTIKSYAANEMTSVYAPVPYNLDISLYALTKGTEDGLAIVEQILPLFSPSYNLNLVSVEDMRINQDVPISLNSASVQDDWEGDFQTRRFVTHTFSFTAKVMLYGPVKSAGVIERTDTKVDTRTISFGERIFTSEGDPTTGIITREEWAP